MLASMEADAEVEDVVTTENGTVEPRCSRMAELPAELAVQADATCGACLLELNADGEALDLFLQSLVELGGFMAGALQIAKATGVASRCSERLRLRSKHVAALEGCLHLFHVRCIQVWSQVENSCPQCRSRFRRFGEYNLLTGKRRVCEVQERDQQGSESEDITCDVCGGAGEPNLLLLCDGRRGRCPGASHTFCDGLGRQVPAGRWFCRFCRPSGEQRLAKAKAKSRGRGRARAALALEAQLQALQSPAQSAAQSEAVAPAACVVKREKVGADVAPAEPPMGDAPMGDAPMKAESGSSGLGECSPSVRIKQEARQANPPKGPTELKEPRESFGGLQSSRSRQSVLSEKLKLRRPGAESTWELYSHQAEALDALSDSKDVVVSTSTGSGKSLVYQIPIFEALLKEPEATAILVFPTKALAQDQLRALKDLAQALAATGALPSDAESWVACLDGDTLGAERTRVRREAKVVLSNPDMLHSHVLPQHVEYARLLQNLHYVVLDEVHVYRGAFGAHVCNIIRRLRRVVEAPLQFIACSATVANPGEHLERLLGPRPQAPSVVARDGSPSGGHVYVLWNPAALVEGSQTAKRRRKDGDCSVEAEASVAEAQPREPESTHEELINGARASPIVEVTRLIAWLVSREVSVLAFCKWRSLVEIVLQDVREALADEADLSRRVVSYRAGYPAHLRRQLEKDIFARKVLGVACTNALELGIDIGRLDCTLSLGFPGSVSSLKQQFGRAGRAGHPGISFFVGFEDPIDQHFMRAPRELLARRAESVAVAPLNLAVLALQLPCLAAERAIDASPEGDARFWRGEEEEADAFQLAAQKCLADGSLERGESDGREALVPARRWAVRPGGPHRAVSIRAVEDHFEVVEEVKSAVGNGDGGFLQRREASHGAAMAFRKLDEIELSKAFYSLHPGAVYRYRGAEYHVADLDLRRRRATVQKCEAPLAYYTRAFDITTVRIHTRERQAVSGQATVCLGQIRLESRVKSFRRFWKAAHQEGNEDIELNLPSWGYSSRGLWFEDPLGIARQPIQPETARDGPEGAWTWGCGWAGAHAAMHALLHVFPLFVLADRQDLDAACIDEHGVPPMDHPRLMLFDAKEGGLGLCDAAFPHGFALLREARRLVEDCACESGCPQCIVDSRCREYNRFLSKRGALEWLSGLESGCEVPSSGVGPNSTSLDAATHLALRERRSALQRQALTLPENFHNVVQAFEEAGMEPLKTEVETRVEVEAPLGHEQTYEVLRLLHQLEDIDDVGEVHHNAVFNDEVELKFNAYGIPLAYATAYKKCAGDHPEVSLVPAGALLELTRGGKWVLPWPCMSFCEEPRKGLKAADIQSRREERRAEREEELEAVALEIQQRREEHRVQRSTLESFTLEACRSSVEHQEGCSAPARPRCRAAGMPLPTSTAW
ncbi:unnamed protein product [Effrenium voratum]|nr:unnamed protein product [Effrenium voratum]